MKAGRMLLLSVLSTALLLAGCAGNPLAPKTTTSTIAATTPRTIAKPDVVLACRMLKASYCAYDISTASYDAVSHTSKLNRCESRIELQLPPALSLAAAPPPYAYLTPAGTNAFLVMQTDRDEIILAFRGTIGLGAGLLGYLDWLNNFQASRVSDELLGNVHFGFHNALFEGAVGDSMWESLWRLLLRLRAENTLAGKKLFITGHSKGGALALLAAARLKKEFGITATAVYTFESPRAGTVDFAQRYAELGIPTFRFENHGDIVPLMPPEEDETVILAALGLPAITVSWWDPYVAIGQLGFIDWDRTLRFPEETPEFKARRSREFVENLVNGDARGIQSEELRARLQFNHRILPGGPSYFEVLCGGAGAR
jgi:hypothetical protein